VAAGVCYAWNPFVAERLIMGQWALLLGYAGLPWVVREICRAEHRIRIGRLATVLIPAAVGGFAAMSISALAAVPAAICGRRLGPAIIRRLATVLGVLAVLSLVWLIPAFVVPVHADPHGVDAFAARSDTPFGATISLLMLGGIWNAEAVPAGYGGWASVGWLIVALLGLAGYVVVARRQRNCRGLGPAALTGAALAAIGISAPTRAALAAAISFWPGFALLRDGQQFLAPLALAEAIGFGAAVNLLVTASTQVLAANRPKTAKRAPDTGRSSTPRQVLDARRRSTAGQPLVTGQPVTPDQATASGQALATGRPRTPFAGRDAAGPGVLLAVLALLAPVLLLPGLAWGAAGRLHAVSYPADWLRARQIVDRDPRPGSVLLLPWAQYRRYPWNNFEAVYDPWPRLLARTMIWNDALRVGPVTVAAESAQARRLGPVVTSGRPMTTALRMAGIRYVVIDAGPLLGFPVPRRTALSQLLPGAEIMLSSPDLILCRIPTASAGS
jgi:hypothetical protein